MTPHKHAELLRIAADDDSVKFYSITFNKGEPVTISNVISYPLYDWKVYQPPKKMVTKYLWITKSGNLSESLMTEFEAENRAYSMKLEWSKTECEES